MAAQGKLFALRHFWRRWLRDRLEGGGYKHGFCLRTIKIRAPQRNMTQTVICMKWGTRYGPDYVNRLNSMVRRHTARPTRLVCYTDETDGIDKAVETYPLPHIELPEKRRWWPWRKISLWQK